METCNICREYIWSSGHNCSPAFLCAEVEKDEKVENLDGLDWREVRGFDEESAAQRFGEEHDDDNFLLNGGKMFVLVKKQGSECHPKLFEIFAEAVVDYTAYEVLP